MKRSVLPIFQNAPNRRCEEAKRRNNLLFFGGLKPTLHFVPVRFQMKFNLTEYIRFVNLPGYATLETRQ